ncbi:MAG: ACP S-malonyltransferase [Bdellovibrionota bacterium]
MSATQILAMFSGQGSQQVGMGKDLCSNFKMARDIFEEASDAIGLNLKKLCFEGPESDLTLTQNTQPSLLTVSVASFRIAQTETGFIPTVAAGHSLGEYSALVATGAISLATAARWVRARGLAMQKAVPAGQGTMAAVLNLDDGQIDGLCKAATESAKAKRATGETSEMVVEAVVEPANFNAPGQTVIAGSTDAVNEAITLIKAGGDFAGGKAIPLTVSAPFHCRLMKPAREKMADIFSKAGSQDLPKTPNIFYAPNRTARLTREAGLILELLIEQVDHPVLWKQTITALLGSGMEKAVEFGPGKVLCGLVKRISQGADQACSQYAVNDSNSLNGLNAFLKGGLK